jgi:hypothetical protein
MGPLAESPEVPYFAVSGGILHQRADDRRVELERCRIRHPDLDTTRFGPGSDHGNRLGVTSIIHQVHRFSFDRAYRQAQVHGLGCSRRLIQQRRVGHFQPGQIRDHGLEVEQRFQPSLGDFRLIGCIGGVPSGVFQNIPLDHLRREAARVAHSDVGSEHAIHPCQPPQSLEDFPLAAPGGQRERAPEPDFFGYDSVDEIFQRRVTQQLQHVLDITSSRTDMAIGKVGGMEHIQGGRTQFPTKNAGHLDLVL